MLKVKEIVEELKVFERNKVPLEIRNTWYSDIHPDFISKKDFQNSCLSFTSENTRYGTGNMEV
jgi:hypothetical protein